jgi:hypothetical protein
LFFREPQVGLPDGFFSNPKSQFGQILEGLRLENMVIFYGHLEYFFDHLVHWCSFGTFIPVLVSCSKKYLATLGLAPDFTLLLHIFVGVKHLNVEHLNVVTQIVDIKISTSN